VHKTLRGHGISGTQTLQATLPDEAVICRTQAELCVAHLHSSMQTEKLICKMVNLQQKGNISEGSDEGILTEVL